jgi:formylglycine-generating enzyme required for sulfatase activity
VAEWVSDWYEDGYYADSVVRNPQGPSTGERKVQRGGAWGMEPVYAQAYYRTSEEPEHVSVYAGFRCAMPAPSP